MSLNKIKDNLSNNEFLKGFIVGSSQTISGHPFDTIKTNIQANRKIHLNKLYKGIFFPFISHSVINSFLFGFYSYSYCQTNNHFLSGMIAGFFISPIVSPLDKLKIDYQIGNRNKLVEINSKQLFKGIGFTISRESLGAGIYFYSYNFLKKQKILEGDNNILISGGMAGVLSWFFTYPIDVIKTRIQGTDINSIEAFKKGGLFNGIKICLLRSFLVNSIGFFIYEKIR